MALGVSNSWPVQGARDHSETLINGNINFGNNGEVV
jgi:hypothetical protein